MKRFIVSTLIVLSIFIFGAALNSSAKDYYYYDSRGRVIERHHDHKRHHHYKRQNIYDMQFITPSNPFDNEGHHYYYYNDGDHERRYYYYERDRDDDVDFRLDIF